MVAKPLGALLGAMAGGLLGFVAVDERWGKWNGLVVFGGAALGALAGYAGGAKPPSQLPPSGA
jgi:hypothetical protein